ncbi:hypothetical protein JXJ21_09605 [candidate division KSB1 bacterium]|nr:hypothetical protein [candidate division KSB1 bacterium]
MIGKEEIKKASEKLIELHGEGQKRRIETGVRQVAQFWQARDGSAADFARFCTKHFIADADELRKTSDRFENALEQIYGHYAELRRELLWHIHIDTGPVMPVDYLFAEFSPDAHANEDFFQTKVAFVALLNFPMVSLEERLKMGPKWTREQWAQARLVENFSTRVPSEVEQKLTQAYLTADDYISNYNIYMHHVLTEDGKRLFPKGLKLITHWGLRDELKARYADPAGLPKQEMIYQIMLKIIQQEIPQAVINNSAVDWTLSTNSVAPSPESENESPEKANTETVMNTPEPDARYQHLLNVFRAERLSDPYHPDMPTKMARRFQRDREIPEAEVKALFDELMTSPAIAKTAQLISKRLGRPLKPFDIWYTGFKARGSYQEEELDKIVARKYPTVSAFQDDLPFILRNLGFSPEKANFLASKIEVDPSRGAGHAMEGGRRVDNAHLRTRIPAAGMNYKGYNIAIHEFGHNVEQVFSLNEIDHTLLRGVPNTAFTEGFAFIFQARDLELLGLPTQNPQLAHLNALSNLWATYEIAGVSLVDMAVWHWMYEHPDATAGELKTAVIQIAKDVWNKYFAPVFGEKDVILLAVYSHIIDAGLYLPDYPLGHIIAFQIEEYMKDRNLATEMERMCKLGAITPDEWMHQAVGQPISVKPMLTAAEEALKVLGN